VSGFDASLLSSSRGRWHTAIDSIALALSLRRAGRGLVHVHSHHGYGLLSRGISLSGLWSVAHVHSNDGPESFGWAFRRPPDLIVTCARYLADLVRRTLPPSLQERQWIEAVPNAVDTRRFAPGDKRATRQRVGAPAGLPLALMLANLSPHKGQETAIRAVAILKERGVPLHCWLAGTERGGRTAHTEQLTALIAELDVADRVRLLGHRDDADELLRAADFFLLPSRGEGLPLSVLEAQAAKVPVLAAPMGGVTELVTDGETGFLIAFDDPRGYAERIKALLDNPVLSHRVAERAHARTLSELSWEAYGERMIELYGALLDPGRHRPRRGWLPALRRTVASC
jgi:glycosyltransferase involved in cell wall biosynthesis